jgi:hypothetical protein
MSHDDDDLEDIARQLELTKLKVAQLTRELEAKKRSKLMREAKSFQFDAATQKIENVINELRAAIRNDEHQDRWNSQTFSARFLGAWGTAGPMEAAGDAPYIEAMQKKYVVVQLSDNEGEILEVDPALISAFESFRPAGGWTLHDNYWLAWGEARLKGLQIRPARWLPF